MSQVKKDTAELYLKGGQKEGQGKNQSNDYELTMLRLGDGINYPSKGELVGVHYTLRNSDEQVLYSTYQWGKIFEWRVGSASMLPQIDNAICKLSLGGKAKVAMSVSDHNLKTGQTFLSYYLELIYIK